MGKIIERCAGIDVGKRFLLCCVLTGAANEEPHSQTLRFDATVPALERLRAWLQTEGVTHVAMESTGSYWIPIFNILEDQVVIVLANPEEVKNRKGHKTDRNDAKHIADLLRHEHIRSSYIPPKPIRQLRDLTRRRVQLTEDATRERNRVQKLLEQVNVKIGNVLTDVFGVSGQEMIIALLDAAQQAATAGDLAAPAIERFLRTSEETWDGAGSGRFTPAQFENNEAYRKAAKTALRTLFRLLANLLPAEARLAPQVAPDTILRRIDPMVKGLVQGDWQEVALRELVLRTFVLNFQGAKAAMDVELSSCDMESAWRILWALYGDYGLKPDDIEMTCDGLAGDFAHVRWSAYESKDPYSDVVVHETAHVLHYLKPRNFGLYVGRGHERFVDIEFRHRELFAFACEAYSRVVLHGDRKSRISFAEKMQEDAFSFPRGQIEEVAALVLDAARSRNGWRVIREATVIHRIRGRLKTVPQ